MKKLVFKYHMHMGILLSFFVGLIVLSCENNRNQGEYAPELDNRTLLKSKLKDFRVAIPEVELNMIKQGLVDIQSLDSTIVVDLKYSSTDNFLNKNVYQGMRRAYLQPDVARRLVKCQRYLKSIEPEYALVVYDATRPNSVQQIMWDALDVSFEEKIRFLSNPRYGSVHSFGAAVDVSIVDVYGVELDMGTEFDYMGELAYPRLEQQMLKQGRLESYQVENRKLLREVMAQGGFWVIQTEWWHFNAYTREQARERYSIIE